MVRLTVPATDVAAATVDGATKLVKRTASRARSMTPASAEGASTTADVVPDTAQVTEDVKFLVEEASTSLRRKRKADDGETKPATPEYELSAGQAKPPTKKRKTATSTKYTKGLIIEASSFQKRDCQADNDETNPATSDDQALERAERPIKRRQTTTTEPVSKKQQPTATKSKATRTPGGKKTAAQTPQPPATTPLLYHLHSKLHQVTAAIAANHATTLTRDNANPSIVSVISSHLLAAISNMRMHYQIGRPLDAKFSDVVDAIVEVFQAPVGRGPENVDWFRLDLQRDTGLEDVVRRKLEECGVEIESMGLLEAELEMVGRQLKEVAEGGGGFRSFEGSVGERLEDAVSDGIEEGAVADALVASTMRVGGFGAGSTGPHQSCGREKTVLRRGIDIEGSDTKVTKEETVSTHVIQPEAVEVQPATLSWLLQEPPSHESADLEEAIPPRSDSGFVTQSEEDKDSTSEP